MTERAHPANTTSAAKRARARRPRAEHGGGLDPELRALVERAALLPNGLALLIRAPLECAAVLLRARPRAVERARAALEDRGVRREALDTFARAAGSGSASPAGAASGPQARPRDAEELLLAARRRPDGLALLFSASAECAAIAFGVHPDLVHAARELGARRGLSQELPAEP